MTTCQKPPSTGNAHIGQEVGLSTCYQPRFCSPAILDLTSNKVNKSSLKEKLFFIFSGGWWAPEPLLRKTWMKENSLGTNCGIQDLESFWTQAMFLGTYPITAKHQNSRAPPCLLLLSPQPCLLRTVEYSSTVPGVIRRNALVFYDKAYFFVSLLR